MTDENENQAAQPDHTKVAPEEKPVNQNDASIDDVSDSIDELAQGLLGGMPDVSEHVVEAHNQKAQELEQANSQAKDKRGDVFNAEIHAVDDNGEPKYTAAGYFAKKRGRKTGQTNSVVGGKKEEQKADPQEQRKIQQRAAGTAAANSLIMLGVVLGGDEWHPVNNAEHGIDEKRNLENAFADYFTAKDMDDLPAGAALSIAVMGYMLPRFTMPKTKQRTSTFFGKIKKWWINRKLKKHNLKAVEKHKKDNDDNGE